MSMHEEVVAIFVSPEKYAYHINQVVSISTDYFRVLRKRFSIKMPYEIEEIPITNCTQIDYQSRLSPVRIFFGILLVALMLTIFYLIGVYGAHLEQGTSIRIGLLALALITGLKWAFMSRQHQVSFLLNDGTRLHWCSRSGDFKYKERAVSRLFEHLETRGLRINGQRPKSI
ncbi:hypothetical protein [Undibacterium sp. RuTC16W]|uniref:hypothetical protein n=1 Tax=Undibacterium sp. RuTC16W TaxID=3413048 RepID=UPI003BF0BB1D